MTVIVSARRVPQTTVTGHHVHKLALFLPSLAITLATLHHKTATFHAPQPQIYPRLLGSDCIFFAIFNNCSQRNPVSRQTILDLRGTCWPRTAIYCPIPHTTHKSSLSAPPSAHSAVTCAFYIFTQLYSLAVP